jgi:hypothetical protein
MTRLRVGSGLARYQGDPDAPYALATAEDGYVGDTG